MWICRNLTFPFKKSRGKRKNPPGGKERGWNQWEEIGTSSFSFLFLFGYF